MTITAGLVRLTMARMAQHAIEVYGPDVSHLGLLAYDDEHPGGQFVSSVLAGSEVLAYDGEAFEHLPTYNLNDSTAGVWRPFTLTTAWEVDGLGRHYLTVRHEY